MSVVSVRARDFILALFIRDDGQRFLLGDNGYDFKDSQLHFSANSIENDEVAKQGVDGVMLAGQVRRASVQSFDGYVGDATTLKEEIEQMRRDFIAFFAKGHHFRVIYIDCNRNAWQRKGGYLVDAPEVKELWQIHPEYHVGLNFEDVNYYEYDENAEGEEILSNIIPVPISSDVEGGLVWDEYGAVSEPAVIEYDTETASASGTNISISDAAAAPLSDLSIYGNTTQNGTPTPSAPVAVQTVTGENVVKICGKNLLDNSLVTVTKTSGAIMTTINSGVRVAVASGGTYRWGLITLGPVEDYAGKEITVSANMFSSSGVAGSAQLMVGFCNEDGSSRYGVGTTLVGSGSKTWTMPSTYSDDKVWAYCLLYAAGGTSVPDGGYTDFTNLQVEFGSTATTYEPYQSQSYPISLGSIELCKIGDYQDSIYKSGGKWYVHKAINKKILDGSESWEWQAPYRADLKMPDAIRGSASNNPVLSNKYKPEWALNNHDIFLSGAWNGIGIIDATNATSLSDWKTYLASNNTIIYYALAAPTDTEITNSALIEQLDALLNTARTYAGVNNIFTITPNEQGTLEISYYTKYDAKVVSGGYVWEAGGSGGPTIVTNESISAVSPVWTVFGPALNPKLENTTTGEQIQYVGMVGEGQTLVVDMGEQTARLDGLNVISNIVGEYLTLAPGSNKLLFSADSDAPASEIGWSEIVG